MKLWSKMKRPPDWLVTAAQWFTITILTGFAVLNSLTDHGIAMAVNCFFLGFMFFSMLMRAFLDRKIAEMDKLFAEMKLAEQQAIAAATKFETAINDGFIEVIEMVPTQPRPITRH